MISDIDDIIAQCQQNRQLSNSQLRSMLLSLALSYKQLLVTLQQSGVIVPQQQQQRYMPREPEHHYYRDFSHPETNKMFFQLSNQLLKPKMGPQYGNPHGWMENQFGGGQQQQGGPICLAYINRINQWWPPQGIAAGIGVPGFAKKTLYNHFVLAFWTYANGPLDVALIWSDPLRFFGGESCFGKSKEEVQKNLKAKYNENGIKIMVSAFGSTQFPTTAKVDPIDCAEKLGAFVKENNLDGVDIDWEDNDAMEAGTGQAWLIKFQTRLRSLLPSHIISHAPQAPYFSPSHYKNNAYNLIHSQVGSSINFYNIQFYNQGSTSYSSYETLFKKSGSHFPGTSVFEIAERGVPLTKIVIGKPVTQGDVCNTGLVGHAELGEWVGRAQREGGWATGVMFWQYVSDLEGKAVEKVVGGFGSRSIVRRVDR